MSGNHQQTQDATQGLFGRVRRIFTLAAAIAETRLRLAVLELEEEKTHLIQLLLMIGLTLLFATFGLMSLLILLLWVIEPENRLLTLSVTTLILLSLALCSAFWVIRQSRQSTLLKATRQQLKIDRQQLEEKR